jgi:hypothetical protein
LLKHCDALAQGEAEYVAPIVFNIWALAQNLGIFLVHAAQGFKVEPAKIRYQLDLLAVLAAKRLTTSSYTPSQP